MSESTDTAAVRWRLFMPTAALATAVSCVAGYLIVGAIHPIREPIVAYGLVIIGLAFVWSWCIQLLLDAARKDDSP